MMILLLICLINAICFGLILFWFNFTRIVNQQKWKWEYDAGKIENIPLDTARNDCISNCKITEGCEMVGYDSCDNWYHLLLLKLKNNLWIIVDNLWKSKLFGNVGGHYASIKMSFSDKCFSDIVLIQIIWLVHR